MWTRIKDAIDRRMQSNRITPGTYGLGAVSKPQKEELRPLPPRREEAPIEPHDCARLMCPNSYDDRHREANFRCNALRMNNPQRALPPPSGNNLEEDVLRGVSGGNKDPEIQRKVKQELFELFKDKSAEGPGG